VVDSGRDEQVRKTRFVLSRSDLLEERIDTLSEELEIEALRPRRTDVEVRLVTLAWNPER
jgi:hypothetical protein